MNLKNLFNPSAVAVIGASSDSLKIGRQILDNLIKGAYRGRIFPINLHAKEIAGLKAYADLKAIPGSNFSNMLVIIAIPAQYVLAEVEKGASLGLKNFIIISAGFKESGPTGKKLEDDLLVLSKKYNLHILGPNCLGMINSRANLNATFASSDMKSGRIALLSQSGAIGSAVLDWLKDKSFGLAYFFSLGNKTVLGENELMTALANDKNVDLIVLYLEEIQSGEKLMALVSKLAKKKPVVILKAGQSLIGGELAASHTGSLAGSGAVIKTGIIRAGGIWLESLSDLFNFLKLFRANWHNKIDKRLSIITNAGGLAVLTVDEIDRCGLLLGNSFDILGDATSKRYEEELLIRLKQKSINSLLVVLTPQTATEPKDTALVIIKAAKMYPKKIIMAAFVGGPVLIEAKDILNKAGIPTFDYPEEAVKALSKLVYHGNNLSELSIYKPQYLNNDKQAVSPDYLQSLLLLKKYKIPTIKTDFYKESALKKYTYPVVLKAVGPDFVHKTDKNAVIVGLKDEIELKAAANNLYRRQGDFFKNQKNYLIVQPLAKSFQEIIIGFKRDASFGPIIIIGWGGIYAEIIKDIALETGDIDLKRAKKLITSLKVYPILKGARGQSGYAIDKLAEVLVSVALLARENPTIQELDINPLFVFPDKVAAADVRIII